MTDTVHAGLPGSTAGPNSKDITEKIIDRFARGIIERRLETPAVLLLEMNKPLSFLMGQSVLLASPLFAPLFGIEKVEMFSQLLNDRENVERLIQRIEDLAVERERMRDEK